ncbi:hypothetical protein HJA90_09525 [Rhizobium bangladeshense]|uniref:hypothetical protein n=1 Tax=Rhizobium bangladeshense TaxID=1138189 RepID=UPI001C839A86|nr:hypothetical protein [Rhizobium bangladeshense]MBX4883828.1 hypothetical protein [Rhizobium bangladeshense]
MDVQVSHGVDTRGLRRLHEKGTVTMTSDISEQEELPLDKVAMLAEVHNERSRAFFTEAVDCFNVGAYRASVVMMSCAVFDDIRSKAAHQAPFDRTAKILSEKLEKARDEQGSYESDVLNLTSKWDPLDNEQRRYLKQLLDSRNQAAHASGTYIAADEARRMIEVGHKRFLSVEFLWSKHGIDELISRMSDADMYPAALPYDHEYTTRHEIDLRHPNSHFEMLNEIAKGLDAENPRFNRNATIFLYWTAVLQDTQFRKYLSLVLIQRRSLPPKSAWLIDVLGADPAILSQHSKNIDGAVDAPIAAIIQDLSIEDEDRIAALEAIFRWLLKEAKNDEATRLRLTLEAALRKLLLRPSFFAGLSMGCPYRALAQQIVISSTYDHDRAEDLVAAIYGRWEDGHESIFGRMLDGEVAFSLVMNLCAAGEAGKPRCSSLSKSGFGALPGIRRKAVEFLASDPDKADMLLEDTEWYGYSQADFFEQFLRLMPENQEEGWHHDANHDHDTGYSPKPFGFLKKRLSASAPNRKYPAQTDPVETPSSDAAAPGE